MKMMMIVTVVIERFWFPFPSPSKLYVLICYHLSIKACLWVKRRSWKWPSKRSGPLAAQKQAQCNHMEPKKQRRMLVMVTGVVHKRGIVWQGKSQSSDATSTTRAQGWCWEAANCPTSIKQGPPPRKVQPWPDICLSFGEDAGSGSRGTSPINKTPPSKTVRWDMCAASNCWGFISLIDQQRKLGVFIWKQIIRTASSLPLWSDFMRERHPHTGI